MEFLSYLPTFGGFIWTVVFFVVALSVIVAIHEYGHYIVGRWSGIHADVFSIGFGPILWSRHDKRGTRWQIAALPFGGFVKFAGDANAASGKDEEAMADVVDDPVALRKTMHGAPLWARAATVSAGPVFNFILSSIVFAFVALNSGQVTDPLTVGEVVPLPAENRGLQAGDVLLEIDGKPVPDRSSPAYSAFLADLPLEPQLLFKVLRDGTEIEVEDAYPTPPRVSEVIPQSAAIAAGLQAGDVIQAIDGKPVFAFIELKNAVESSDGRALNLTVWRAGDLVDMELAAKRIDTPKADGGFETAWRIGVASGGSFEPATESLGAGAAVWSGITRTGEIIESSISGLWHIIIGDIGTCNLSGPVGIAQVSGQMASQGALSFVIFIAVLSTAVGLLNLFPIPALDGGHLVFYAFEAVTGRPPSDAALRILMTIGLTMVLSLMVFALYNDFRCP